jgi:molybdopterin-guanine dinucleotide biosynthesis protein A
MTAISVGILAGGQSLRMGQDKAFLPIAGQPVVLRVLECVSSVSDDVVLITNTPEKYRASTSCRMVKDIHPGKGPLCGIHSALNVARYPHCLIVACDMPFLNAALLRYMADLIRDYDVVVPRVNDRLETIHALYNRTCLASIERHLLQSELAVRSFFDDVRVRVVESDEVARFDPLFRSFLNMNTPADWEHLQQVAESG